MAREDVTFTSGGCRIAAWLYRPEDAGEPVPCVVMAHGFSGTRSDRLPAYAERFAAAGLAALVFDYRHFGDSEGEPRQLLDIGRQHADYEAAMAFARGLDGIDPQRIVLWGSSFSGGHVIALAARNPDVAAVVSQAPFTDGLTVLRNIPLANAVRGTVAGIADQLGALAGRSPRMMPATGEPGSFAAMTAPEADPGFAAITDDGSRRRNEVAARIMLRVGSYRPAAAAKDVACPLLVCACEKDQTTPHEPAVWMAQRAPRGELKLYPIGHFDIYLGEDFERAVTDQVEFLRRHVLDGAARPEEAAVRTAG